MREKPFLSEILFHLISRYEVQYEDLSYIVAIRDLLGQSKVTTCLFSTQMEILPRETNTLRKGRSVIQQLMCFSLICLFTGLMPLQEDIEDIVESLLSMMTSKTMVL